MDARLSRSSCDYTSIFALTATKGPRRPAEVLDVPLAPQGTPSARTAKETKGNGGFRAVLVARYREMRAGRPLAGLRASAAAVRPLPSPHHSWALPDTPALGGGVVLESLVVAGAARRARSCFTASAAGQRASVQLRELL